MVDRSMTGQQLTIDDAIAARDSAMQQVEARNESLNAGWASLAYAFLTQYASRHRSFYPWEVTTAFERGGFVAPTTTRAWGPVYLKAVKAGLIARGNTPAKHPQRHAVLTLDWISLTHKGAMQ